MSYDQTTIIRVIAQEEACAVFAPLSSLSALPPDPDTSVHLASGDTVLLVAAERGYALLNFNPRYAPFRRLNIPEIQDLNVHPAHRRQGLAAALVRACEDLARRRGCDMIGLGVGLAAAYGPAQRLYCRLGYLPDGAGLVHDAQTVPMGMTKPNDHDLCLMMIKVLK